MKVKEIFDSAGLEFPAKYGDIEFCDAVTDSRLVRRGSMFIALRGYNTDGHNYIEKAIGNGASVIVAEQVRDECVGGAAIILIDNTRRAAALLYNAICKFPSKRIKLVGVTGTNGKTSICFMLKSIFEAAGIPCGVIGTTGAYISGIDEPIAKTGLTTPEAAQLFPLLEKMADMGAKYVFMEVSSHALARGRVVGLEFELGIFTNLSRDHLDFHGSMENYFLAKASLFSKCKHVIVNRDDAYGRRLALLYGGSITCSAKVEASVTAKDITLSREKTSYKLKYGARDVELDISLGALGDFSVINSLEAAAAAICLKIEERAVKEGLSRFFGAKGRFERVYSGEFDVLIDYAHTPDALERVLESVRKTYHSRTANIITVFGCGGERDKGKRKQMGRIASRLADITVISSDNPRSEDPDEIIKSILKGVNKEKRYAVIPDRKSAIEYAISLARAGDVVLVAGKGHETYQIDANGEHPFDEIKIINDAIVKKL